MISPTIGRVVLVVTGSAQPLPGLISFVHNDRLINVGAFDQNGKPVAFTSLVLLQDDDKPIAPQTYAEWMPYQKGQAAKTKALEAKLNTPA